MSEHPPVTSTNAAAALPSAPRAPGLTCLHLFSVSRFGVPAAVARMAADRPRLARTRGLRFWKLLGTGDGRTFDVRDADLRTWALLTVWQDPIDLARFERTSPVAAGWRRLGRERWRADLWPLRAHGRWSGCAPFTAAGPTPGHGGRVAAITRARLRWDRMRTFWQAVPPVNAALHDHPGLLLAVGIGEAPVGLQGTFSVWESATALRGFAYGSDAHRQAIRRTPQVGWYAEELFARFALLQTTGTLWGGDPLARRR